MTRAMRDTMRERIVRGRGMGRWGREDGREGKWVMKNEISDEG